MLILHGANGYTSAPQCNAIRTVPILLHSGTRNENGLIRQKHAADLGSQKKKKKVFCSDGYLVEYMYVYRGGAVG